MGVGISRLHLQRVGCFLPKPSGWGCNFPFVGTKNRRRCRNRDPVVDAGAAGADAQLRIPGAMVGATVRPVMARPINTGEAHALIPPIAILLWPYQHHHWVLFGEFKEPAGMSMSQPERSRSARWHAPARRQRSCRQGPHRPAPMAHLQPNPVRPDRRRQRR